MLLKLKVRNFLSFSEEVSFDMFPNLKRTSFLNHIYCENKVSLLKQAAIYGANGSGKSNLLKAVDFIKKFAINKDALKTESIFNNRFRLKKDLDDPICFFIEFHYKDSYFIYEIELNDHEIVKENLYISGLGESENELIYNRSNRQINPSKSLNEDVNKAIMNVLNSNPMSSLMSLNNEFPVLDDRVKVAHEWFNNCLNLKSLHSYNSSLINQMEQDPNLLNFTNDLITKIGLGVERLEINEMKLNDVLGDEGQNQIIKESIINLLKRDGSLTHMLHDKVLFSIEEKDGERIIKRLLFHQLGIDGFSGALGFDSQSDGTAKVLNLIPVLYDLVHNESVYFIDEIENSIHPLLIARLIKYFSQTQTKGQLIYTTHETELLNQQELMRPDEVWFTEKHDGQTKLYSLNDFKEHNTINIKNGYLDGRYGAIPFIGDLNE